LLEPNSGEHGGNVIFSILLAIGVIKQAGRIAASSRRCVLYRGLFYYFIISCPEALGELLTVIPK